MLKSPLVFAAMLAALSGCFTVSAAGQQDCKERGCAWNEATARCECYAPMQRRIPGKLEGQ
jgi:hypothetical protein